MQGPSIRILGFYGGLWVLWGSGGLGLKASVRDRELFRDHDSGFAALEVRWPAGSGKDCWLAGAATGRHDLPIGTSSDSPPARIRECTSKDAKEMS